MSEYFSSQSADGEESGGVSVYAFLTKWCSQPWKRMADLAEAVDDLICSFDYMDTAMDNLVMLAFIWVLVTLVMLGVGRWAYGRFYKKSSLTETTNSSVTTTPSAISNSVKSVEDGVSVKKVLSTANEIVTSADSVLATSAKTKAGVIRTKSTGAVGGGFVPPTPPNKRRLARMSPGPDHPIQRKTASIYVPTCTGPDPPSVQWVNEMFMWLYNDLVIVNELIQLWIVSMNEFSKKSVEEQGIGVELVRALDSNPPSISNVFCECDTKNDVTITADCEATPAFQLKAFRQKGDKVEVAHYRVNVNRFRARLSIACITDKLTGELRCDGWPEVKVALAPVGPLRPNADEANLQDLVSEIVVSALRNTFIEFNFISHPTCPRLRRHFESPGRFLPLHYDSMLSSNQMYTSTPSSSPKGQAQGLHGDRRLLVKIVGAKDLGGKTGCLSPYCVVEMDEPAQKNQTAAKKDTNSPNWDEHFLFDLSHNTAELLFEVYDRTPATSTAAPSTTPTTSPSPTPHRFLGLGIVGIDELLVSPSQRQLISLQGRPMEEEDVSGILTVEFLFIEGADIPDMGKPFKLKETLRTVSPSGQTLTTTKTTFKQNGQDNSHLKETALRELEASATSSANKSTLIIHSVQREPKKTIKVEITESGRFIEVENEKEIENHNTKVNEEKTKIENGDVSNVAGNTETESKECGNTNTNNTTPTKTVTIVEADKRNGFDDIAEIGDTLTGMGEAGDYVNHSLEVANGVPQPAPRQKKRRDFFGTIKRRLGRSKTRGASVDNPESGSDLEQHMRSISADRTGHPENALNIANRMTQRNVYSAGASPAQSGDESRTSRRSSLSEMSGVSAASARTFIHEASTLVLETVEAGIKKHYLVPLAIAQRSRWRRKGVKLHIYNEHTFIAKHLSGGTACQVCRMNVARRIGKQGYECRDCLLKCHKHCHVKVPETCPQTTVPNMELSYITSPYTDKNIRML